MLGPEGGRLWYLTLVREENGTPFMRVWKSFPSRRALKNLDEKWKAQKGQYLPAVGLGRYNFKLNWRTVYFEDININCVRIQKKKKKKKKLPEKGARITTTPRNSHTLTLYVAPDAKNTPTNFSCALHNPLEKRKIIWYRGKTREKKKRLLSYLATRMTSTTTSSRLMAPYSVDNVM